MNDFSSMPLTVEKFAAYLDGNLPEQEMKEISNLVEVYDQLMEHMEVNEAIENAMEFNELVNDEIPEEIVSMDFDIPDLDNPEIVAVSNDYPIVAGFYDYNTVSADTDDIDDVFDNIEELRDNEVPYSDDNDELNSSDDDEESFDDFNDV